MNNFLLSEWTKTSLNQPQLLIVMVVLGVFAIVGPLGISIYQLMRFKKFNFEKSFMTKWLVAIIFVMLFIGLVSIVITFVFYFGGKIGSLEHHADLAKTIVITFISISAGTAIVVYLILIFANNYIALGINKESVYVFGEVYRTEKIISLVLDKDAKLISLHIAVGKRVIKRIRYGITSMCGQCLQSASDIMNVKIVEGNDKEIYINEVQKRQEEFRRSLTKSVVNAENAKEAVKTVSKASKTSKAIIKDEKKSVAENDLVIDDSDGNEKSEDI